jgi:PTS system galactitol-specific IIB component
MGKKLRLLVACGSGIATSTVAAEKVQSVCKSAGVEAEIIKCTVQEIPGFIEDIDAVLTTTRYREKIDKPLLSVVSFITGLNEADTEKELSNLVQSLAK